MRNNFKQHLFSMVPKTNIPRSSFNRSHTHKTTMNSGKIIPVLIDEVLPGDTINFRPRAFARLATLAVPVMDDCYLDFFCFFVPNRLVWNNWQKFCGEQENPGDSTDYLIPTITAPEGGFGNQTIFDYMGLPTQVAGIKVSALPFRGYNLIWNEWFRDENLQDSVLVEKGDSDNYQNYVLLSRGKRHDYFTSCIPFPQKGNDVTLPLGQTAQLTGNPSITNRTIQANTAPNNVFVFDDYWQAAGVYRDVAWKTGFYDSGGNILIGELNRGDMAVDLSTATSIDVNDLRMAFQLQKFLERQARGGKKSLCLHVKKIAVKNWKPSIIRVIRTEVI